MTWAEVALGDLLTRVDRPVLVGELDLVPYAGVRWNLGGVYPREEVAASTVKAKKLNRLAIGDITYNRMWATKAAFGVVDHEAAGCLVSNDFPTFRSNEELALTSFIKLLFTRQTFQSAASGAAAGTTERRRLKEDAFLGLRVLIPGVENQRRICDLIESVDSYISALRVQVDAAHTTRTSLLHELLIDTSGDWTKTTLDAVGTWRSGGTPKAGDPRFYGGDIPFVAIGDLTGGVIRTTEKTLTPVGLAEIGHLAPEGSIFVSMYGSIGKTGVAGANMATNQAIAWLEPDLTVIDPAFMASWLTNHAAVFDSQGRGATQRNINRKMIRETPIVLPPLRVQNEIAHTAESINNLIGRIEETLSQAATVRQGILAELLSGNHEIPESYDALLEAS